MKKEFILLIGLSVLFLSCKNEIDLSVCNSIEFTETTYNVEKGKSVNCITVLDPAETIEYNNIDYSIINEKIAVIDFCEDTVCKVTGKKSGATLLTAKCCDLETKCIISVLNPEAEEERSIIKNIVNEKKYLYEIKYKDEFNNVYDLNYVCNNLNNYQLKDDYLIIEYNENKILISINNIVYFNVEEKED